MTSPLPTRTSGRCGLFLILKMLRHRGTSATVTDEDNTKVEPRRGSAVRNTV